MIQAKVTLTPEARLDLRAIRREIKKRAGPRTALKWVQRLRSAASSLAQMPYKGLLDDQLGARRRLVVSPYLIVYRMAEPEGVVIVRVLDGRRDLASFFRDVDRDQRDG